MPPRSFAYVSDDACGQGTTTDDAIARKVSQEGFSGSGEEKDATALLENVAYVAGNQAVERALPLLPSLEEKREDDSLGLCGGTASEERERNGE